MQSFDLVETDFLTTGHFLGSAGEVLSIDSALAPAQVLQQRLQVKPVFA